MDLIAKSNISFGWNVTTHMAMTEKAIGEIDTLSNVEKRMLGRFSQMPDFDAREVVDFVSPHFYDVLYPDPSFGTKNDARNNAMSRFLTYARKAMKETDREMFLRKIGYAVHYLQDVSTPPHVEHGNYLHKLFRIPMHNMFEKGKKLGATSRLDILEKNYMPEEIPFSNLKQLFHNTALYTVQPENKVKYTNIKQWFGIQQRCFNRGVNVSKTFINYMMQYLPKKL